MFSMRIGCYAEDTISCVWLKRGDRWVPAWYHYNDPELSNYKQLRF